MGGDLLCAGDGRVETWDRYGLTLDIAVRLTFGWRFFGLSLVQSQTQSKRVVDRLGWDQKTKMLKFRWVSIL